MKRARSKLANFQNFERLSEEIRHEGLAFVRNQRRPCAMPRDYLSRITPATCFRRLVRYGVRFHEFSKMSIKVNRKRFPRGVFK